MFSGQFPKSHRVHFSVLGLQLGGITATTAAASGGLGAVKPGLTLPSYQGGLKLGGLTAPLTTTTAAAATGLSGVKLPGYGGVSQGLSLQGVKRGAATATAVSSSSSFQGLGGVDPSSSGSINGSNGG